MPQNNQPPLPRLTAEQIEVRIWGFVVIMVTLILVGIVSMLLYSVTFVTQPIKSMAPIDQAYTKMLNDIVLLIVGGIGGIMTKRAVKSGAESIANANTNTNTNTQANPQTAQAVCAIQPAPAPAAAPASAMPNWNWMGYQNPELDEKWTPPPPPTTPPDYIPPEAAEIAQERAAAKGDA